MSLFATAGINQLWYMAPLIVAISLVYGATRHEYLVPILQNALRAAWWIISFMGLIFLILLIMTWLA
jgi:hypothetical protein